MSSTTFTTYTGSTEQEQLTDHIQRGDKEPTEQVAVEHDPSAQSTCPECENRLITEDHESFCADETPRTVGVRLDPELGTLYVAAVVGEPRNEPGSEGTLLGVDHQTGREFRHHLARIDEKHSRLYREGKFREAKACSGERRRYTDHVTHTVLRSGVDFAKQYEPCAIQLDNLTQYRDDLQEVQHGWPYSELREKIAYKATEAGLPVTIVASNRFGGRCSRCGESDQTTNEGAIFTCDSCGYQVHSKVNEAVNIAIER